MLLVREQDAAAAGGERKREVASGKDAASISPESERAERSVVSFAGEREGGVVFVHNNIV